MKYYPLEAVDRMKKYEDSNKLLDALKKRGLLDNDVNVDDLMDYVYSMRFFMDSYKGKFEKVNNEIMFDEKINNHFFPMYKMKQIDQRATEWKDVLSTSAVVDLWSKCKMVYKIDNDFFHELKLTENLITTEDTFINLPFKCFYIDLSDVKDIVDFQGAFVYIKKDKETGFYGVNIYMVQGENFTFFTYYAWYNFEEEKEIKWEPTELPTSEFVARSMGELLTEKQKEELLKQYEGLSAEEILNSQVYIDMGNYDPRHDIIVTIFQIMSFIAIDASDVHESPITKKTYKPNKSAIIKNKFSEVKIWDVGVQYGKAIRVAKKEYKKRVEQQNNESLDRKDRKPTRPHIRRAHWHKYHVGQGRKEIKMLWLAPVYVCGNGNEIPVTIREVKK